MTRPDPTVRELALDMLAPVYLDWPDAETAVSVLANCGLLRDEPEDAAETEVEWSAVGPNGWRVPCRNESEARRRADKPRGWGTVQSRTVTHTPWRDAQ